MDQSHYLHVRVPGRGRVTLSLPGGVERALISGRLSADAEVWHETEDRWIPIARHPEVIKLLELAALPVTRRTPPVDQAPGDLDLFSLPRMPAVLPEPPAAESAEALPLVVRQQEPDPAQLPLISLTNREAQDEFTEFLERSSAMESRREAIRASGPLRTRGPGRVLVAGARELRRNRIRLQRLAARYSVPGWAGLLVIMVLSAGAITLFFVGRATGEGELPIPVTVTNALSAAWRDQQESKSEIAALAEPNPLAEEEQELESNLRIAEAVVWQPAIDFSSREQLWRSSRKVDAVRNSISLYRIGAWRLIDSTQRDTDPRLEPFEETVRVDQVLGIMRSAVSLLDSMITSFRVNGDMLVFADAAQAARYADLRQRADSLLLIPLPGDSLPLARAPRRVVSRLLQTLPSFIVQPEAF